MTNRLTDLVRYFSKTPRDGIFALLVLRLLLLPSWPVLGALVSLAGLTALDSYLSRPRAQDERLAAMETKVARLMNKVGIGS